YRGFQSTVEAPAHFGVGAALTIDSVVVEWPDGLRVKFTNVPADTTIKYSKRDASIKRITPRPSDSPLFKAKSLAFYRHPGGDRSDIKLTRTLMHELSRYGPCLAKADVNGDGLDDFFVGGQASSPSLIFIQQESGLFQPFPLEDGDALSDGYGLFFDADSD